MEIKYSDIEDAFMFISFGAPCEHDAYLNIKAGETHYSSDFGDYDDLPEDIYENDDYIAIPQKMNLILTAT